MTSRKFYYDVIDCYIELTDISTQNIVPERKENKMFEIQPGIKIYQNLNTLNVPHLFVKPNQDERKEL